ncbi:DUF4179 domain-containing protein [Paenibacillus barcinonensis]|uniref:DUF4179 domain-containing protein n=1 Tax=Paenibacillus barcinonensis TaxID=198119 RepID=UPI001C1130FD|nr:DUF4179 domain-containing protein [Paenibacillus barcinonensis]MBU5353507.1 DUF4179 domain-containing protein [Paenibacillus barcinonensis]
MKSKPTEQEVQWEKKLFQETPDFNFTENVMKEIEHVEMEHGEQEPVITGHGKRMRQRKRRRIISAAAACILLAGSLTVWTQPKLKHQVLSVFSPFWQQEDEIFKNEKEMSEWTWYGDYLRSKPLGLIQYPKVKVEDKGYSFEVKQVQFDGSRMIITVVEKGPDGKLLQAPLEAPLDEGGITVTDLQGNKVVKEGMSPGGLSSLSNYVFLFEDDVPDMVIVQNKADHITVSTEDKETGKPGREKVDLDWKFQFKVDTRKGKEMAVNQTIKDAAYTTKDGLEFELERLIRTVNGVRLDMNITPDGEMISKLGPEWWLNLRMWYHFETEDADGSLKYIGDRINYSARKVEGRKYDSEHHSLWLSHTPDYTNLSPNTKKLKFVLDGYSVPIKEEAEVTIKLEQGGKTNKAVFKDNGDQINFDKYTYEKDEETKENELRMDIEGILKNDLGSPDDWAALDHTGREYQVEFEGAVGTYKDDLDLQKTENMQVVVKGFPADAKEITIKRKSVDKVVTDVDWSVDLPSYTTLPWEKAGQQ